jgi:hypothetical protein
MGAGINLSLHVFIITRAVDFLRECIYNVVISGLERVDICFTGVVVSTSYGVKFAALRPWFCRCRRQAIQRREIMKTAIYAILFLLTFPHPLLAQYVYLSPTGGCSVDGTGCMDYYAQFYLFIRAEDVSNSTGASFFIEGDEYSQLGSDNILSIEAHEGVVIESGDLFSGMTLSWPEGQYTSDTLLTIALDPDNLPALGWAVFTRDIRLYRVTGNTLYPDDFMFYCSHCYGTGEDAIWWQHPDTVTAVIGKQSLIDLPCIGESPGGFSGTDLDAFDANGWIDECTHCSVGIDCGPCPWDVQHVLVAISIPNGTEEGTTDLVRLIPSGPCCMDDSTSVYVRAVSESGTARSSWGAIKHLYKDE